MPQETSLKVRSSSSWSATRRGACVIACLLTGAVAAGQEHWGYSGEAGAAHWAKLSPACAGSNQSPVDLARFAEADLPPIQFSYAASVIDVVNNGHTVQVASAVGSQITMIDSA